MNGKKVLVAYFSASGVTAQTAKTLAEVVCGELHEIKPLVPYTKADLDWMDKNSRSTLEMKDRSSRPAITDKLTNMADYDIVYVGFPIWWYIAPTIINTFLESYDFSDKTIVPFCTSGSSDVGKTDDNLRPSLPESVNYKPAKLLNRATKETMTAWVNSLGIIGE